MTEKRKPRCMQTKTTYTFDYPEMLQYEKMQMENYWLPSEVKLENCTHELRTGLTDSEYHGVLTTLKLFTLYETHVGKDYWLNRYMKMFPRPEFERIASINGMVELNIHAPFYNEVNEILRLNTDEFYKSYVNDVALKERMEFIEDCITSDNDLLSLAIFSMIEGAVLYSNFAYLLHFQANGKNKLANLCSGIGFSVVDENYHSIAGAATFRIAITECVEDNILTESEIVELKNNIIKSAKLIKDHEFRIIDMIFEKGEIEGFKEKDIKNFVKSRINLCLNNLGIDSIYDIKENPIAQWFYNTNNTLVVHDFFNSLGNQYNRNWSDTNFIVEENTYNFIG